MDTKIELIAKLLLVSNIVGVTPDDMWRPQRETVKDGYRVRAEEFVEALEVAGYTVVRTNQLEEALREIQGLSTLVDDLNTDAYQRGYDKGREDSWR